MPDKLTRIAVELEERAARWKAAISDLENMQADDLHNLGVANGYEGALDLVRDLLGRELTEGDELQALREAARRRKRRLAHLAASVRNPSANAGAAQGLEEAMLTLREETADLMGEGGH